MGITADVNEDELKGISSNPQVEGENYFRTADFQSLDAIREAIVQQTCRVGGAPDYRFIIKKSSIVWILFHPACMHRWYMMMDHTCISKEPLRVLINCLQLVASIGPLL